ncbi:hypothetical protein ABEX12_26010 [Brevibacillus porteri]
MNSNRPESYWGGMGKRLRRNKTAMAGVIILIVFTLGSLLAPVIAPHPVEQMNFNSRLSAPSTTHLLGTDDFGRDIFSRLLHGGRISLLMGLITVVLSTFIGVTLGIIVAWICLSCRAWIFSCHSLLCYWRSLSLRSWVPV